MGVTTSTYSTEMFKASFLNINRQYFIYFYLQYYNISKCVLKDKNKHVNNNVNNNNM